MCGGKNTQLRPQSLGTLDAQSCTCRGTRSLAAAVTGDRDGGGGGRELVGGGVRGKVVGVNVGAECESEKEGEAGVKPHHKKRLRCMTHNFIKLHDMLRSVCVSS